MVASKTMSLSVTLTVLAPSFTGNVWSGLSRMLSRNAGSTVAGSFPTNPASEARSVPWPLPGGAEAAEQVHLERRRLGELVRRQLRAALVEIVGDAHRADRVRARGARPHLVELVQRRHHRTLCFLHDVQVGQRAGGVGGPPVAALSVRSCAEIGMPVITAGRTDHGAAHEERATIHAGRDLRRNHVVRMRRADREASSFLSFMASLLWPNSPHAADRSPSVVSRRVRVARVGLNR